MRKKHYAGSPLVDAPPRQSSKSNEEMRGDYGGASVVRPTSLPSHNIITKSLQVIEEDRPLKKTHTAAGRGAKSSESSAFAF